MKSSMRQWWKLALVAMLAWVLVFFVLLTYFLDTRANEPLTSSGSLLSQHPDTRRLNSIQASNPQHAIVGLRPTTYLREMPGQGLLSSSSTPEASVEVSQSPHGAPYATYSSQEVRHQDYLDPQSLAAWSSFGTENVENVGSHLDPAVQSRERSFQITEYPNQDDTAHYHDGDEEDDGRENETEELGNRRRAPGGKRPGGDSTNLEEYYFSKFDSVVHRLWRGRVSSNMLSPRLQQAMKVYMSANKHSVSYKGHRRTNQSAKELLCQMQAQARLRTLDGSEEPFSSLGWLDFVPSLPLEYLNRRQEKSSFKTCAVVTSAGAMLHSRLGKEIGK